MKQKDIIAIILAGGAGKRLWPIETCKPMIRFLDKTLLEHALEQLYLAGIRSAVVVANPSNAALVSSIKIPTMEISVVTQETPLGMADAVLRAKDSVGTRPCLIVNAGDVVDDALFDGIVNQMDKNSSFIVAKKVSAYFPGGYVEVHNGMAKGILEKPGVGKEPSNLINLVFHYFSNPADFFHALETTKSAADDVYEKALSLYAATHSVGVVAYDGPWQPMKYPCHVLSVMDIFLHRVKSHKGKGVIIKKNVILEGPVYIEDGVKIFENTKIVGPCYIGKNTIIGNNCIIRGSHIGENCVIGFNTDITRSYIGDNCWFHSNYIGDSVLEGNISMGSGAALANLRLDDGEIKESGRNKLGAIIGKGVRIGVNASIMPGVKIGKNSFIGSGVVLEKDLPEDSFCMMKPGYTVIKNIKKAPVSREAFKKKI